jgi:hypothetical protein
LIDGIAFVTLRGPTGGQIFTADELKVLLSLAPRKMIPFLTPVLQLIVMAD